MMPIIVTPESSTEDILAAIEKAGELNKGKSWRQNDWPDEKEGPNAKAWVRAGDIGISTRRNSRLLGHLKYMATQGFLEMRYWSEAPRFRVRKPDHWDNMASSLRGYFPQVTTDRLKALYQKFYKEGWNERTYPLSTTRSHEVVMNAALEALGRELAGRENGSIPHVPFHK